MAASSAARPTDEIESISPLPTHCFLKISIAGEIQPHPVVIQLFVELCPMACRNFVNLCTSKDTTSRQRPCPSYRGCEFHRIIDQFMVQCGDFERFDGSGGYSSLGDGTTFKDENLQGKHDQAGIVSMANKGKNTNGSQFFITLKATLHLDGKHVVFGRVESGMGVVEKMLTVERMGDRPVPIQRIVIVDCGLGTGVRSASSGSSRNKKSSKKKKSKRPKEKRKTDRHRRRRDISDSSSDSEESYASSSTDSYPERKDGSSRKRKQREKERSSDDSSHSSSSHEKKKSKKRRRSTKERKSKSKRRRRKD